MANKAKVHVADLDQDETARVADVIAALVRSGALKWSALARQPVTGQRSELNSEVEEWLRNG